MTSTCPSCGGAINYTEKDTSHVEACPHCAARLILPASEVHFATRERFRRGGPAWEFLKMVGLAILTGSCVWLLLLVWSILKNDMTTNSRAVSGFDCIPALLGIVAGYVLFSVARQSGAGFICSKCGSPIRKNEAGCAVCGATISS